ncbi:Rv3235 family protein [Brevibacterium samyangense]|uniref:Energy transducer TonB n=1 Tax=Brevibacterium samyangense TaxID=366888 RepID=A0ABN2THK5_9MICO
MTTPLVLTRPTPRTPGRSAPVTRTVVGPPAASDEEPDDFLIATVRSLATAIVEVMQGARAAASIARWVEPELLERLRTHAAIRGDLARSAPPLRTVQSTGTPRLCRVSPTVVEAAVVITTPRRSRGTGLRLEHVRGRWCVTGFVSA